MRSVLRARVPAVLTLGTLAGICAAAAVPGAPRGGPDLVVAAATPPTPAVIATARGAALVVPGVTLCRQLALDPACALVVLTVALDTPAAEAGLCPHDVLVGIDDGPASPEALDAAVAAGGHVELTLVRGGDPHVALLPAAGAPVVGGFVTQESLAPEHPILELRQLERLHALLTREVEAVDGRRREVRERARATRAEARAAAEALHGECVEEARRFLDDRAAGLRCIVDDALAATALDGARALRMDLEGPLPVGRTAGLAEALHEVAHVLEDDLAASLAAAQDIDEERVRRHSCALSRVASGLARRAHERVHEPWERVVERRDALASAFGPRHDERIAHAAERLEGLRGELHERLDCAVERATGRFAERLEKRLQALDVPRTSEVVRALEGVAAELDAWTMGFVRGVEDELGRYEGALRPGLERLQELAPARLEAGERALEAYAERIGAALAAPAPHGTWDDAVARVRYLDDLRARLAAEIGRARDALRPGAEQLLRSIEEERRAGDEAWQDLRDALRRLGARAADDCWKLDGPHLDGRDAERPRGEVVLAR